MHPRAARMLFPLFLLLALSAPTAARVIEVGPQREASTLNAALARAQTGDEIVLDRATEHLTPGVVVRVDAIEIRSADGPGDAATIRNTSADKWPATIEHRGEGLILRDLILAGAEGASVTGVRAKGTRLIVDNVSPAPSLWRFVALDGAQQTSIRNCTAPILSDYTVCSFGETSRNLLVERCTFAGSTDEHVIRLHRIQGAVLRDSTFLAGGKKSALTVRDGADVRVENCTINGPMLIGPLADGDGGINHPTDTPQQRARRDALLRLTLRNVTLKRCTIDTSGITVEMGVQNLVFDGCWIKTSRPWALRLNRDQYEPWRNIPSGRLVHCELSGPVGLRPFERPRADFHVLGTVINGTRVADTTAPTSNPSPGGAVPGETPATNPTPAPATQASEEGGARAEHVIAALEHVDDALTRLHVARDRLHASTQPAGDAP